MVDALIGQKIGKYEIIERIGHGGMSEVFKACCANDGSYVAIKLLHAFHADDPSFLHRFTREARAMSQLDHPSIVHVYDFDTKIDKPFIAMEYLGGGTLKEKFSELQRKRTTLSLTSAVRIVLEIADALAYAHSRDMVHRDIKPANIIFNDAGRAVLTDFGIVKTLGATQHTTTGAMIGTPAYMSPEQGLGRAGDARSDVYALGVLFFQMVTGRLPYDADKPLAVVLKHINEPIPYPSAINPDLPDPLELIVMRALAKNPLERFQSANEMAEAVRDLVRNSTARWVNGIPEELVAARPSAQPIEREATHTVLPTANGDVNTRSARIKRRPTARRPRKIRVAAIFASLLAVLAIAVAFLIPIPGFTLPIPDGLQPPTVILDEATPIADEHNDQELTVFTSDPTPTPIEATEADCDYRIDLISTYTFSEGRVNAVSGEPFPINWIIRNLSNCPLPADASFGYEGGESFSSAATAISFVEAIQPEEEVVLTTMFSAPGEPGSYAASWQVFDSESRPLGTAIEFAVEVEGVGVGAAPDPTAESAESAENDSIEDTLAGDGSAVDFDPFIQSCEFDETGWRCQVYIVPSGGADGVYTIRIDEDGEIIEYNEVATQTYEAARAGCQEWVQPVEIIDPASGESRIKNVYFNPSFPPISDMIANACQ